MCNISLNRICADCKNEIIITKENMSEIVLYGGKYYHKECFINMCNIKLQSQRCKRYKWDSALRDIDTHIENALFNLNKEFEDEEKRYKQSCKNTIENKRTKEKIYTFMCEQYEATNIPKHIFIKLNSIYSGTFRGMNTNISPEELLDMWIRKIDYLNKVADSNKTKGNEMNSIQRINYDLSILINKYDSYKKWKEGQKILEYETASKINNNRSLGIGIINEVSKSTTDEKNDELSSLVDDIFD
jgi:hypothetical protein